MTWLEYIKAVFMVSKARIHLSEVMLDLKQNNYHELINDRIKSSKQKITLNATVKSYFWASRTLKNCQCLPRSIALYQRLIADGHQVEHKFGVNKQDKKLAAHAWVEHQNKPLNESKDLKQRFVVMKNPD